MNEKKKGLWDFALAHPWMTFFTVDTLLHVIPVVVKAIRGVSDTYVTNNYSTNDKEEPANE